MKYLKFFEGFKELEFINTETYRIYVKNKFKPMDIDFLLDLRSNYKKLKDQFITDKYDKEIKAIDFILKKHF